MNIIDPTKKPKQPTKAYPSQWELMLLAEEQDSEAFEAQDFDANLSDYKQQYKDFYDDVKIPADYVKEDW